MYRKFREDPSSVDASWHEFLVDYSPEPTDAAPGNGKTATQGNSAPTAPPEPAPAPAPKTAGSNGTSSSASKPAAKPEAKAAPKDEAKDAKSTSEAKPKTESKSDTKSDAKAKSAAKQENAKQDSTASAKAEPAKSQPAAGEDENQVLRGAAAAVAKNMSASLEVPTATSVRAIPAKAMIDNRIVINNHLKRTRGGKISFTHLLGYAIVQAVKKFPNMNRHFTVVDGKPNAVTPAHTNLGLAIDLPGKGGQRALVVAAIKNCETMTFGQFIAAYEDIVRRARDGKLTAEDFSGVTISLTNPGTIGTVHSVPRLMQGQGAIIGAGAMEYPAEFQGASEHRINEVGVGKLMTLTSTYDHRIIQGAESGDFLRTIHQLLLDDDFYDEIFRELGIPYEPVRWRIDNPDPIEDKSARVIELIAAYRNRGHLMADIDPLRLDNTRFRSHPDLDVNTHGLTLWDLDREFKV
ncbi:2-oxo acid dehydrogenase subunit E2, partial [Mycolicibacterium poriferae]|uniref:2-oxo acid dehydrogenase subunit E2 n=2 Tax=Mycolicibacterium poriferae TaxID=39694 RepID=UPI0024B97228